MLAYTYVENGRFELIEKEKPMLLDSSDCEEILRLVEQWKLDPTALITHTSPSCKKRQTIPVKTIKKWKFA